MAQIPTTDIASGVRAELARRRRSGRELATAVGWSERTMRRRLAGTTEFTATELAAIAKFLDVSLEELFPAASAA